MTTPALKTALIAEEGLRLHAYQDEGGVWTIGVGHTGAEVVEGLAWSRARCLHVLDQDVARVERGLDQRLPWWRRLDGVRQDVLADMAFNLGVEGLVAFRHTLEAVRDGDYARAAQSMLASEPWARQVGARARRLAAAMRCGCACGPEPGGGA